MNVNNQKEELNVGSSIKLINLSIKENLKLLLFIFWKDCFGCRSTTFYVIAELHDIPSDITRTQMMPSCTIYNTIYELRGNKKQKEQILSQLPGLSVMVSPGNRWLFLTILPIQWKPFDNVSVLFRGPIHQQQMPRPTRRENHKAAVASIKLPMLWTSYRECLGWKKCYILELSISW